MSTIRICDRCGIRIGSDGNPDELVTGDGNAYHIQLFVNHIDAKGWTKGDYHARCLAGLLAELTPELSAVKK